MKPFNLEKFLAGEPAITRDGRKVIDFHYFKGAEDGFRLQVQFSNDSRTFRLFDNGKIPHERDSRDEIFMKDKEVDLWINVFDYGHRDFRFYAYSTEKLATEFASLSHNFKGTHKITIK